MQQKGNEKYKDSIFRYLFSDADNFVDLYFDISGNRLNKEEVEFYDTESIVAKHIKNDVAFKTKDNRLIVMVEHQSTLSENMPLRFLMYYSELIKMYIIEAKLNIFARKAVLIPKPEFYVVYNGKDKLKEKQLSLEVNLGSESDFVGFNVKLMDISYDSLPNEIKERHDILDGYSYFVDRIRYYLYAERLQLNESINKAKRDTLEKGYLREYLNRKEFIVMITKVLTIEEEIELIREEERKLARIEGREQGIEEGREQGIEEGREQGIEEGREKGIEEGREKGIEEKTIEIVKNMLNLGIDIKKVSQVSGLSEEEIRKI